MILLIAQALAGAWTIAVPLSSVLQDGGVEQPAGVAMRLESADAGMPYVRDRAGPEVELVEVDGAWVIPAPDRSRTLSILVAHPAATRFRRSDPDNDVSAWMRWDVDLWGVLHHGGAIPETPTLSTLDRASIALRAAAVPDRDVAWLGALSDTVTDRPWGRVTHVPGEETPLLGFATLHGPGLALVKVSLPEGALTRFQLVARLDGVALPGVPMASTGSAPVVQRIWIPPGEHRLAIETPGADDSSVTVRPIPLRRSLLRPVRTPRSPTGIDEAEWLWLQGERDAARIAFAPWRDAQGPAGELARARLLATATTPEEALALAEPLPGTSADGYELLADAALQVAQLLPPEVVLGRVRTARDPDLVRVARWLDTLGGSRPRGLALLRAAAASSPDEGGWGAKALREASLVSRWSRLGPDEGSTSSPPRYADRAPGITRIRASAGDTLDLDLPVVPRGRFPVLRMTSSGYLAWTLDGKERRSPGGVLDVALPPGVHQLRIVSGSAILADPEVVTAGGTQVWEWTPAVLPARWTVPDAAWEGEIRVQVEPPSPVVVRLSDGTEHPMQPYADGTFPALMLPAGVDALTVEGPPGAAASVSTRTGLRTTPATRPAPRAESAEVLEELSRLSAEIDAGASPLERALLLASVGQLSAARRDLARVRPRSGAEATMLRDLWDDLAPPVPTAPAPGPRTVAAALAEVGFEDAAPADAAKLAELARRGDSTMLWSAAAQAWLDAGDVVSATWAANQPEVPDPDILAAIEARTRWTSVSLPDAAAGISSAPLARKPAQPGWSRQVRDAMLHAPWSLDEVVVLRGGSTNLVKVDGAALRVEVFCRDESGTGATCPVVVQADAHTESLELESGEQAVRSWVFGTGRHTIEVQGPGAGRALVLRTFSDNSLVPPTRARRTLLARPGKPVLLTVGAPGLVRASAVRGEAVCNGVEVRDGVRARILPLREGPRATVRCEGDADLLLDTGALEAPTKDVEAPAEPTAPMPVLADAELRPAIAALIPRTPPPRTLPGEAGTFRAALSYLHESVAPPDHTWDAAELAATWLRGGPNIGWVAELWGRAPAPAAGAQVAATLPWTDGFATAEARAGYAVSVPVDDGAAWSAQLQLRGRQELRLSPSDALRLDARLRGGTWSEEGPERVDLRAWTSWDAHHPFFAELAGGWAANPTVDTAFQVRVRATSNSFGDDVVLDAIGPEAAAQLLVGKSLVFGVDLSVRHKLADAYRAEPFWWSALTAEVRYGLWDRGARFWEVWADAGLVQTAPELHGGLRVYWTSGRGLHDLPPDSIPFRTARDLP